MPATTFVNINCKKKPLRKTAKQKRPHALRHVSGRQTPRLNAKPTALQRKTDRPATPNGTYRNAKRRLSHTANSPEKAVSSGIPPPVCPALHAKTAALPPQRTHSQPLTLARPMAAPFAGKALGGHGNAIPAGFIVKIYPQCHGITKPQCQQSKLPLEACKPGFPGQRYRVRAQKNTPVRTAP